MSLSAGTKLGPYEILVPLGAGGMGEVYRARDTRLGRDVAVKVLPPEFASDPERLRRFEQEARATAALDHPNILAVYDIGTHEGTAYIVEQLLEGESLRQRLHGGPLPPAKAVEFGIQIAQGLAAAHEKAIVHRDLKPGNLFITKEGRIKILDFGLARLRQQEPLEPQGQSEATTADSPTREGKVFGTPGYMAPEQVRGKYVDARTDLFAFGCMLYEMVTGKKAFTGSTYTDIAASILKEEPPDLQVTGKPVPPELERIIRRCLEKLPEHRFQSARDLAFSLEGVFTASCSAVAITSSRLTPRLRESLLRIALAGLVAVAAGFAAWLLRRPPGLTSFVPLTHDRGTVSAARFVPGTSEVIYSASWGGQPEQWYTRRVDQPSVRTISGCEGVLSAVSRDGEALGLARPVLMHGQMTGSLYSLPTAGGSPRELADDQVWGGDLGSAKSDAAAILGTYGAEIRLEWPLGHVVYRSPNTLRSLRIQGDRLVVFQEKQGTVEEGAILVIEREGRTSELVHVQGFTGLAWGPSGDEVWISTYQDGQSRILAVDMKGHQRALLQHAGRLELQDVNSHGSVLAGLHTYQRQTFGRRAGEASDRDLGWLDAQTTAGMSADGARVLLTKTGEWSLIEGPVYLRFMEGRAPQRLDVEGTQQPWLSTDGRLAVTVSRGPRISVTLAPTGPGVPRSFPLPDFVFGDMQAQLSADGKTAFVWGRRKGDPYSVYVLETDSGAVRRISKEAVTIFLSQSWCSPDGRWLACVDATPGMSIVVFHPDGSEMRKFGWLQKGEAISGWGPDSVSLIVWDRNRVPALVEQLDLASGRRTELLELVPPDPAGVSGIQGVFVALDGKTYAYNVVRKLSQLYLIEGLR